MSKQNQDEELVDMGVKYPTPIKAPAERVWAIMIDKVYNTAKYLPVSDVKINDIVPGKEMHREMLYHGKLVKESFHFDEANCEIRCDVVGEDAVRINKYYADTGIIEYWQENKKGDRIPWLIPKADVLHALKLTKELAEASN